MIHTFRIESKVEELKNVSGKVIDVKSTQEAYEIIMENTGLSLNEVKRHKFNGNFTLYHQGAREA